MPTVFLGGTCNGSNWRDELVSLLRIESFNPVVADWNEEAQAREIAARSTADFVLYTITPKMTGVYSIAEVVDDSNKRPEKTVLVVLQEDDSQVFADAHVLKSLKAVARLVKENGGQVFESLSEAAQFLNQMGLGSAQPA